MRELSIAQICAPARIGGLERVVQGLACGLAARGHRVVVIATHVPGVDLAPFLAPFAGSNVLVQAIELPSRDFFRERERVAEILQEGAVEIAHMHGYRADLLHAGPARRSGVAVASTLHGSSRPTGALALYEWMHERSLSRSDAVIAVSPQLEESVRRHVKPKQLFRLPNAWSPLAPPVPRAEARQILGVHPTRPLVGWIGRLAAVKGPDLFLRAIEKLPDPNWHAVLIGDGPDRPTLEAEIARPALAGRVHVLGAIENAGRLASAFDVFALSSRSEGTPIALLEAMAASVPVVAFGVGGVPDVLSGPHEGWIVPPLDISAFAAALSEALRDPTERNARAHAARIRLSDAFDEGAWLERHEAIYLGALERSRARAGLLATRG